MWLPELPGDQDDLFCDAERFGIGVLTGFAGRPEIVIPPAPYVRKRFTPSGWLFAEKLYEQVASGERRQ